MTRCRESSQMRRRFLDLQLAALLLITAVAVTPATYGGASPGTQAALALTVPNRSDSLKFAVLGDFGTGKREQYDLGAVIARVHAQFPFELVVLVGDNLYGAERPQDFQKKFELPYKALLDAGVKFYASLGNHDDPFQQQRYKLFNMEGHRYYSFKAPKQSVRFFALESSYLTDPQVAWFEQELEKSREDWKIPYFHHPPYSSGQRHGSDPQTRRSLEPLFLKYGVSVVFTGHDHFYERIKPQNGIVYFVAGSGGQLRKGNIDRRSGLTAKGFDTDQAFVIVEIDQDELFFDAISRASAIVDSGTITRRK
jgi:predicted phosphodiesterase